MKTIAINPCVASALKANFTLFAVYSQMFGCLDSDIDPVHNPDWRAKQEKREEKQLIEAQDRLADLQKHYNRAL